MPAQYHPVPSSEEGVATYPPAQSHQGPIPSLQTLRSYLPFNLGSQSPLPGPPFPLRPLKNKVTPAVVLTYALAIGGGLVIFHFVLLGAFPDSHYTAKYRQKVNGGYKSWEDTDATAYKAYHDGDAYKDAAAAADSVLSHLDPAAGQPGTFFRDSFPIRSMLAFWDIAEQEVRDRDLNTCNGQLSRELIDGYHSSELAFCVPPEEGENFEVVEPANGSHWDAESGDSVPASRISCSPVRYNDFTKWWPYPASPCVSTNMRTITDESRKLRAAGCQITDKGAKLKMDMGRERFLGAETEVIDMEDERSVCKERLERTVVLIGRQDQWNPFHVAEDLITTLVSIFIAVQTAPALINTRVQLVFTEGYGMDSNHFTPLWDRMGAWAPRRLSLDPWQEGECLTNTIHSVGAGASLLSAMGVGSSYTCASTITWAAAHYYRHLFGLLPPSVTQSSYHSGKRRPINILWLSRAKLDHYAQEHHDWSSWRDVRHINNEKELVARLRDGLRVMCESPSRAFGDAGCTFEDARDTPESWALTSPDTLESDDAPLPVRFAMIDPTVHALETQIHYVGHSTLLVSSHAGALGLSMFLPPGAASILELQVQNVHGNYHFQHMAYEMGHQYEMVGIQRTVDVDQVWDSVRRQVESIVKDE